jgi:hypothetical protein
MIDRPAESSTSPGRLFVHAGRLGRIVDETAEGIAVEFDDGTGQVWKGLPRTAQLVDEGSLLHQSFVDAEGLRKRWEGEPATVVATLLRESGPQNVQTLRRRLETLGLGTERELTAWWKQNSKKLSNHPQIEGAKGVWRWVPEKPEQPPVALPAELTVEQELEQATPQGLDVAKLGRIKTFLASTDDSRPHLLAASAGIEQLDRTLADPAISTLPADKLAKLVDPAHERRDVEGLVHVLLTARSGRVADKARDALSTYRWHELEAAVEGRLAALVGQSPKLSSKSIERLVALAEGLDGEDRPLRPMVHTLATMQDLADEAEASLALRLVHLLAESPADRLASSIDPPAAKGLLRHLGTLQLRPGGPRERLLRAVAASSSRQLLEDPLAWVNIDIGGLTTIASDPELCEAMLDDPTGGGLAQSRLVDFLATSPASSILAFFEGAPPVLRQLVPRAAAATALTRSLGEGGPAADLLRSLVEHGRRQAELEAQQTERGLRAELEAMASRHAQSERRIAELEELFELARAEVRQLRLERHTLRPDDIERSRREGLVALVDLIEEVRRYAPRLPQPDDLRDLVSLLEQQAQARGLQRLDRPGRQVTFDPERHRMLAGDPAERVEVVEPAWGTVDGDRVTVVRYGRVRRANEKDQK